VQVDADGPPILPVVGEDEAYAVIAQLGVRIVRLVERRPGGRVRRAARPAVPGVDGRLVPTDLAGLPVHLFDVLPHQPVRDFLQRVGDVFGDDGQRLWPAAGRIVRRGAVAVVFLAPRA